MSAKYVPSPFQHCWNSPFLLGHSAVGNENSKDCLCLTSLLVCFPYYTLLKLPC